MAYEALIMLLLLALLLFITRLWPILLLVILGIFIATLRLLFLSSRNVPPTQPPVLLPSCKSDSNKQTAYCALIEDINAGIFQSYPDARWIWESPGALRDLEAGKPVIILLNRAGGYRRAELRAEHGRIGPFLRLARRLKLHITFEMDDRRILMGLVYPVRFGGFCRAGIITWNGKEGNPLNECTLCRSG